MNAVNFDFDAYLEELALPDFTTKLGGKVWTFKNFRLVPLHLIAAVGDDTVESLVAVLKNGLGNAQYDKFSAVGLPLAGMQKLFEEWRDASGDEGKDKE